MAASKGDPVHRQHQQQQRKILSIVNINSNSNSSSQRKRARVPASLLVLSLLAVLMGVTNTLSPVASLSAPLPSFPSPPSPPSSHSRHPSSLHDAAPFPPSSNSLSSFSSPSSPPPPPSPPTLSHPPLRSNMVLLLLDDIGHGDLDFGSSPIPNDDDNNNNNNNNNNNGAVDDSGDNSPSPPSPDSGEYPWHPQHHHHTHTSPALTPNIAAMAQSPHSLTFTRFYSAAAICSPTRSSMLTGRTPTRECIITVDRNALPRNLVTSTTAAYAKKAGYATGFFGKWHVGSLTSSLTPDCQPLEQDNCLPGYVLVNNSLCCDGRDDRVPVLRPIDVGFDTALATPQVAPTAMSNCGCVGTVQGAGVACEMGHYRGSGHFPTLHPWLECDQYFKTKSVLTNSTRERDKATAGENTSSRNQSVANKQSRQSPFLPVSLAFDGGRNIQLDMVSVQEVTPVDDAEFLVNNFLAFAKRAVDAGRPFFAQISFHNSHIPYLAPPKYRALYLDYDENHQDYYGSISAVDAQIGRLRQGLQDLGVANNTFLALTSDNGPENSIADHFCAAFPNPGVTGGLLGRKRCLTEGGIRVPGLVEFPRLVHRNRVEWGLFPASTVDFLPTLLDITGVPATHPDWPLDGVSLLPLLAGTTDIRTKPLGFLAFDAWTTLPPEQPAYLTCANRTAGQLPPSFPANFHTPFDQPQLAWIEGAMKLFACTPSPRIPSLWRFSLYNVVLDKGEKWDLWPLLGSTVGDSMFKRYLGWQESVAFSVTAESNCTPATL